MRKSYQKRIPAEPHEPENRTPLRGTIVKHGSLADPLAARAQNGDAVPLEPARDRKRKRHLALHKNHVSPQIKDPGAVFIGKCGNGGSIRASRYVRERHIDDIAELQCSGILLCRASDRRDF